MWLCGQTQQRCLIDSICKKRSNKFYLPCKWLIQCDKQGNWFLIVWYLLFDDEQDFKAALKAHRKRQQCAIFEGNIKILAEDPGARTPHTAYLPTGHTLDIGNEQDNERLHNLQSNINLFKSQRNTQRPRNQRPSSKVSRSKRKSWYVPRPCKQQQFTRLINRMQACHNNLVKEVNCHLAAFYSLKHDIIIMPRLEVALMIRGHCLASKTKQELLGWSHSQVKPSPSHKQQLVVHHKEQRLNNPTCLQKEPPAWEKA